jgi:Tol biopolymer transport system component
MWEACQAGLEAGERFPLAPLGLVRVVTYQKHCSETFAPAPVIRIPLAISVIVAWFLWAAGPAAATFPGVNGSIAFDTGDGPHSQIYTVRPDGKDLRELTHGRRAQRTDPRWSAGGRRIAYISDESGTPQIWVMSRNGRRQHQVTHDPGSDYSSPSWSPDGKRILASRCSHFFGTCDIVTVSPTGTGSRTLVGGYWHHIESAFAPNGKWIAYSSDQGGYDSRVWIADSHGQHRRHLTPPWMAAGRAGWSPTSRRVAFTGNPVNGEIFSVGASGGRIRRLVPPESLFATYSPDGRKLVFASTDPGCRCRALFVARASGRHPRSLASTRLTGVRFSDWGVAR